MKVLLYLGVELLTLIFGEELFLLKSSSILLSLWAIFSRQVRIELLSDLLMLSIFP